MDLKHLQHFVIVAEELHFARAAERLGMAQSPLSQSIMRLEKSLGVKLLERSSRKVSLTPAGAALLPEAQQMLAHAELTESLVKRVAAGELSRIRVGFVPLFATATLMRSVRHFRTRWPGAEVHLSEKNSAAQVDALRSGHLDMGIVSRSAIFEPEGLALEVIERSKLVAAVPSAWPLSRRPSLRLADFADQPLVMFPQQTTRDFLVIFEAACRRVGFAPNIAQQVGQPYTMFHLVANEFGIGFVPEGARDLAIGGVSYLPIEDMPESLAGDVALIWQPRLASPMLKSMVEIIKATAGAVKPGKRLRKAQPK